MRYIPAFTALLLVFGAVRAYAQAPAAPSAWGTAAQGAWGKLWTSSPLAKVMRDTPAPGNSVGGVRIYAAGNEYEPFLLVLTPKKQLGNVRIVPHTLAGPKKAKIEAWNVTVKNVEYVKCT